MLRILQVRMKCAAGTSAHLGSTESLELKIETLVDFNNSTTVQVEVLVKLENCTIFLFSSLTCPVVMHSER
jgi:hypothetical protein